jgi:hypothetical protein
MNGYFPFPGRSWRCSDESACRIAHGSRRFLAAIDPPTVEALRTLFLRDLVARPKEDEHKGGL